MQLANGLNTGKPVTPVHKGTSAAKDFIQITVSTFVLFVSSCEKCLVPHLCDCCCWLVRHHSRSFSPSFLNLFQYRQILRRQLVAVENLFGQPTRIPPHLFPPFGVIG